MLKYIFSLLATLVLSSACSTGPFSKKGETTKASAQVSSATNEVKGNVAFKETSEGIVVVAELDGLKPGSVHGFHIHEKGICEAPDYKSAGDHFNPDDTIHAGPGATEKHAGDLGNIVADNEGKARKELLIEKDEVQKLGDIAGRAIIVHSDPDDLRSQPSGDAGSRIACGIIRPKKS